MVTGDGCAARRGWATGGTDSTPATRRQRGMVFRGALRGGIPPAQGRAEGPTAPELQWSVISGQRGRRLSGSETRTGFSLVVTGGGRKFTPILGCTLDLVFVDLRGDVGYTAGSLFVVFPA